MVKEGISKGLFDVNVDSTWEVPNFQFYMGDLGNSVKHANYLPANDRFEINCSCVRDRLEKELKISRYHEH